jgi:hypothetical protein
MGSGSGVVLHSSHGIYWSEGLHRCGLLDDRLIAEALGVHKSVMVSRHGDWNLVNYQSRRIGVAKVVFQD